MKFIKWFLSLFKKKEAVEAPAVELPKEVVIDEKPKELPIVLWGSLEWYRQNYDRAEIRPEFISPAKKAAQKVLSGKERYQVVANKLNIPWWIIGCIHWREASCSFSGILHNGEKIIGTGKKTSLVPKGRGPFDTWEDAAIDALMFDKVHERLGNTLEEYLSFFEQYNGTGYLKYHHSQLSPYLWSYTTICNLTGYYTADGKYSETADAHAYSGVVAIIKELKKMGVIDFRRY